MRGGRRRGGTEIYCMVEYLRGDYSTFVLVWEGGEAKQTTHRIHLHSAFVRKEIIEDESFDELIL